MNSRLVIVYCGPHFGRAHEVISREGNMLTVRHRASGHTFEVHNTDTEPLEGSEN